MKSFNLKYREYAHSPERKRHFNEQLFSVVAPGYDRITRRLSFGRDQAWKAAMVRAIPHIDPGLCLDVACGTGDLARMLAARYPGARVVGVDLTEAMLDAARQIAGPRVTFEQGDMATLRVDDETVDVLTGGYALRNAPDLAAALDDWRRVLRKGGTLALLDFSKPANACGQRLHLALLTFWGGLWGWLLHRNPDVYGYIADSLAQYPDRTRLCAMLRERGFEILASRLCFFGLAQWIIAGKSR
jgi:ubiquinone/menaquinone biosynthesis methyltransferase